MGGAFAKLITVARHHPADGYRFAPPILLANSYGFNPGELSNILSAVAENRDLILRAWHDHFGN
jgi:hypothetical protein